jgi:alpha-glucosidase
MGFGRAASRLAFAILLAAPAPGAAAAITATSPGGIVQATVSVDPGGVVRYDVRLRGRQVIEASALGLVLDSGPLDRDLVVTGHRSSRRSADWKPLYGERAVIPDRYEAIVVDLATRAAPAPRLRVELRAYDEGVAFRCVLPAGVGGPQVIRVERSEFRFAKGSAAWPIYTAEDTFPTDPVPLARLKAGAHTPLTVRTAAGVASVLEADVADYPRMRLDPTGDGALVTRLLGPASAAPGFATPWRVVLLGEDEARLVENEHLVLSLNPPCAIADTSWILPGKTISNEGSAPLQTASLERVIDFAAENAIRYLQLDWGWYGTEWTWTDAEREAFRKKVPAYAVRTDWVPNTFADPSKVARGPVPYRPDWEMVTDVDLDIPALVRHGREKGVGLCLYVEAEHTLRGVADLDRLFATYREWGIAGLKPGFVPVGTQEDTRWIRRLVETAARHRLWLCVHDAHVPDGMERTWPNLFISEGGGGQEGDHPASHDVTLPFTRNLAGPFDYTPRLYTEGKSHAHLLAFLVVYYAPAPTIRGGYPAWHGGAELGRGGDEIEFLRRVPVTWDETRVLDARIGRRIVVARRSGESWFLGGMSGAGAESPDVALSFLPCGRAYAARIWRDGAADGKWRPARLETRKVGSTDRLSLTMEPAGGFVAILDPLPADPTNGRR